MSKAVASHLQRWAAGAGNSLALAAVVLLGAPAAARPGSLDRPFEGTVVVVVPRQPPRGVDLPALLRAVDVYLGDVPHPVAEVAAQPEDGAGQFAQATEVAEQRGARFAVWFRWSGLEFSPLLSVHIAEPASLGVRTASFAVEYPRAPSAAFYRLVGLKLRSALRSAAEPVPPAPRASEAPALEAPAPEPAERARVTLELAAGARVPPGTFFAVGSFGGALHLEKGRWAAGVDVQRTLPEVRLTAVGSGETSVTRVAASLRVRLARGWAGTSLGASVQAGLLALKTDARWLEEDELRTEEQLLPVAAVALWAALPLGERVEVRLAPTLDIYPTSLKILVRDTVVYSSGRVQPGAELRLQALF